MQLSPLSFPKRFLPGRFFNKAMSFHQSAYLLMIRFHSFTVSKRRCYSPVAPKGMFCLYPRYLLNQFSILLSTVPLLFLPFGCIVNAPGDDQTITRLL